MSKRRPDRFFVEQQAQHMKQLIQGRSNLDRADLEYLAIAIEKLKDQRLKECIATLIGWSDDDRAEIETFVAIAIEIMRTTNISKLRESARTVELRSLTKQIENHAS